MSEIETTWYLCNTKTQFQSNSLSWDEACKTCMEILEEDSKYWHVWQETWTDWKVLTEVSELQRFVKKKRLPPPIPKRPPMPPPPPMAREVPPPMAPVTLSPDPEPPTLTLELEPVSPPVTLKPNPAPSTRTIVVAPAPAVATDQKRKHLRYDIRLRVIIRNAQMTFRTFSQDISLGGICLEHPLPAHLFEDGCHIFIADPNGKENLRINLGPTSRNDLRYFSFSNLEDQFASKLADWLEKHAIPKGSKAA